MSDRRRADLLTRLGQAWQRLRPSTPATPNPGPSPRPPAAGQRGRILPRDVGPVRLDGIDHLEWYVGNAAHTARWLERLGLPVAARQGPDTGVQDLVSYVLEAGSSRILLSTGLTPNHDTTRSYADRGDAVHDVAFRVSDVEAGYGRLIHEGLEPDHLPVELRDERGSFSLVPVTTVDGVLHTLVERPAGWSAGFAPGFVDELGSGPNWITGITSVTTVVAPGRLDDVLRQYQALFELTEVARGSGEDHVEIAVLAHPDHVVGGEPSRVGLDALRLVFVCPTSRTERNHLDDFLALHGGAGVRTVTLATAHLDEAAAGWREAGVTWLSDAASPTAAISSGDQPRRVITEPLQDRSPLVLALEEATEHAVDPLALARQEEVALAAHRRAHPDAEPLGTWGGGR